MLPGCFLFRQIRIHFRRILKQTMLGPVIQDFHYRPYLTGGPVQNNNIHDLPGFKLRTYHFHLAARLHRYLLAKRLLHSSCTTAW